jgi:hypothetical protein
MGYAFGQIGPRVAGPGCAPRPMATQTDDSGVSFSGLLGSISAVDGRPPGRFGRSGRPDLARGVSIPTMGSARALAGSIDPPVHPCHVIFRHPRSAHWPHTRRHEIPSTRPSPISLPHRVRVGTGTATPPPPQPARAIAGASAAWSRFRRATSSCRPRHRSSPSQTSAPPRESPILGDERQIHGARGPRTRTPPGHAATASPSPVPHPASGHRRPGGRSVRRRGLGSCGLHGPHPRATGVSRRPSEQGGDDRLREPRDDNPVVLGGTGRSCWSRRVDRPGPTVLVGSFDPRPEGCRVGYFSPSSPGWRGGGGRMMCSLTSQKVPVVLA